MYILSIIISRSKISEQVQREFILNFVLINRLWINRVLPGNYNLYTETAVCLYIYAKLFMKIFTWNLFKFHSFNYIREYINSYGTFYLFIFNVEFKESILLKILRKYFRYLANISIAETCVNIDTRYPYEKLLTEL